MWEKNEITCNQKQTIKEKKLTKGTKEKRKTMGTVVIVEMMKLLYGSLTVWNVLGYGQHGLLNWKLIQKGL